MLVCLCLTHGQCQSQALAFSRTYNPHTNVEVYGTHSRWTGVLRRTTILLSSDEAGTCTAVCYAEVQMMHLTQIEGSENVSCVHRQNRHVFICLGCSHEGHHFQSHHLHVLRMKTASCEDDSLMSTILSTNTTGPTARACELPGQENESQDYPSQDW